MYNNKDLKNTPQYIRKKKRIVGHLIDFSNDTG